MPNGAKCQKARDAEGREKAVRLLAQSGIMRSLASRAFWHFAPFGIPRLMAFRAFIACG
jgi:hypothetical protein